VLKKNVQEILQNAREYGWVLEPMAKEIFSLSGFHVPRFLWAGDKEEALGFAARIGYPVAAKVVSPDVVHKSEAGGVVAGIADAESLGVIFSRFSRMKGFSGVLVEEMVRGVELIVGAKMDYQFGPVVLLGMGGTGVEVYGDVSLRMAPLGDVDVESMIRGLKAHEILEGYRGAEAVDMKDLKGLVTRFSELVMDLEEWVESIDLNPVMCTPDKCVIADARIMLRSSPGASG